MPRWTFENKITVGNLLTIGALIFGLLTGYLTLAGQVAQSSEAVRTIPSIESRLTKVEVNQANGRADRIDFQQKTEATLEQLRSQNSLILQQLAGISATMKAQGRGVPE